MKARVGIEVVSPDFGEFEKSLYSKGWAKTENSPIRSRRAAAEGKLR